MGKRALERTGGEKHVDGREQGHGAPLAGGVLRRGQARAGRRPSRPDFVRYDPYIEAGEVRGTQTVKENIVWFRNPFPDLTCTIEVQVAERDKVVSR